MVFTIKIVLQNCTTMFFKYIRRNNSIFKYIRIRKNSKVRYKNVMR